MLDENGNAHATLQECNKLRLVGMVDGYAVRANNGENGKVMASVPYAVAGMEITLSAEPAEGYRLDEYIVTQGKTRIDVTDGKFTMPDGDVTVTATFNLTYIP